MQATGCGIQHTGWPCNSCFHALALPGVSGDTLHRMWEATLRLRGDYPDIPAGELDNIIASLTTKLQEKAT